MGSGLAASQVSVVGGRTQRKTLTDVVGAVGVAWNLDRHQLYTSLGYPAEPASLFDGLRMQGCSSYPVMELDWKEIDPNTSNDPSTGIGCDMQGGSSGGPWLKSISSTPTLVGLNSWSPRNATDPNIDKNVMFSPYFGNVARDMINYLLCINGATRCAPRPS